MDAKMRWERDFVGVDPPKRAVRVPENSHLWEGLAMVVQPSVLGF